MNYLEIKTKLNEERKKALIEKDEIKKSIISLLGSRLDLLNKELLLQNKEMTETDIISILSSELKQTKESLNEAIRFDRTEAINKAELQIKFIEQFLPKQLSRTEIKEFILSELTNLNITNPTKKEFGLIMKNVSTKLKGKADGKLIGEIVKSILN